MDEATGKKRFIFFRLRKKERGQALVEYLLILTVVVLFTRMVYFNKNFGFQASLEKTILRLGAHLEQNLKSGTRIGENGKNSVDSFAGTSSWSN